MICLPQLLQENHLEAQLETLKSDLEPMEERRKALEEKSHARTKVRAFARPLAFVVRLCLSVYPKPSVHARLSVAGCLFTSVRVR